MNDKNALGGDNEQLKKIGVRWSNSELFEKVSATRSVFLLGSCYPLV